MDIVAQARAITTTSLHQCIVVVVAAAAVAMVVVLLLCVIVKYNFYVENILKTMCVNKNEAK